jgi:hypothetical protein
VSVLPEHDVAAHVVVFAGYWHAPLAMSQPVAPHAGSPVVHPAVQQLPVPVVPQWLLVQAAFVVQTPVASFGEHTPAAQ